MNFNFGGFGGDNVHDLCKAFLVNALWLELQDTLVFFVFVFFWSCFVFCLPEASLLWHCELKLDQFTMQKEILIRLLTQANKHVN